jgi:hypothetical protein
LDNVYRFIIPSTLREGDLVPLDSLVDKKHTYAGLRQAALGGRLETRIGENGKYYSSKKAVETYDVSRYKR